MVIVMFIIGVVVSMPIVATVVVSLASRREDKAWSLRDPAEGMMSATARRIVDFHSEGPGWVLPKNFDQVRVGRPVGAPVGPSALRPVSQPRRSAAADSPEPVATSKASIRTAA